MKILLLILIIPSSAVICYFLIKNGNTISALSVKFIAGFICGIIVMYESKELQ